MMDAVRDTNSLTRATAVSPGRRLFVRWLPAVLVSVVAYMVLARPFISNGTVFGDLGDARFNLYVLEHTFRYLTGLDASYQSLEIFYPFPGTLLFSDTHIGSVLFYILFRCLGAPPFVAFTLWFFAGYLLTFWAAYYACLRFRFAPLPAVVAAVVFAFSLPSLAQVGHAQLVYRIGVPLAFLSLWSFLRGGRLRDACLLIVWIGYQLLCSIYLGVFLLLSLGVFVACLTLVNGGLRLSSEALSQAMQDARRRFAKEAVWLAVMAAAVIPVALLLYAHHRWAAMYGLGRQWWEMSSMVPRPQSYFLMDVLPYWNVIYTSLIGAGVPMAHEHNLFVGLGALSLFIVGSAATLSGELRPDLRRLSKAAMLALVCLFVLLTKVGNFSLYYYISSLPGLNAIRAVSRVGIVLVFPAALVIAAGVHVMLRLRPRLSGAVVLCLLVIAAVAEIVMLQKSTFEVREANIRVEAIVNEARDRSAGIANPILFVNEGDQSGFKIHLDAMFAARELGWPTVNGYSSIGVPGSDNQPDCDTAARQIEAYQRWHQDHGVGPELSVTAFMSRLVRVGWPDCGNAPAANTDGLGPEPPPELAREISLSPLSFEIRRSQVAFEIAIRNEADERLVVHSFRPVRVSWRFVKVGANVEKSLGWDHRAQLVRDVLRRSVSNVALTAELPGTPGEYRLQVSLVSELAYWFHDHGMEILQFEQPVTVR